MGVCGKKKKKCKGSITTDQSILNVFKNIEHENHLPSSAQVEATKAMLNMHTKAQNNFDTILPEFLQNKRLIYQTKQWFY